ncbi:peptidylprolyl isomerase [Ulvibacter litoralis]|uniref:peptidylprolyl isomerase n=1 Tax=Ulvibacter litoralis TaxID=227084 RepID=A0A1G7ERL5_9FLAO|nr:peptidylprolyl isomerase [Ulvibacter litoralis]GHC54154.1 peptidylprolyl isomerase [Ulvibacter litoralis]SDE66269.1 peptidylprolyl isomerase [Ulvibacter litoralis]
MKKATFLLVLLTLTFASCQNKYPDLEKGVYAEFVTNKGTFVAKLYNDKTPLTVANFVGLSEGTNDMVDSLYKGKKFYDGLSFHRIIKDFMIQGGDPKGDGSGNPGYRFPDELDPELRHDKKGVLSMANSGPGTNGSQFFVTLKETPWLNGRHTVFGEVVLGQEVVDSIGSLPTTKPGDKPVEPVTIQTVNIINTSGQKIPMFSAEMEKIELEKKAKAEKMKKVASETAVALNELKAKADELPSGVKVHFTAKGEGVQPNEGAKVKINYAGYLADGTLFDSNIREVEEKYDMLNATKVAKNGYVPMVSDYSKDAALIPGFKEGLLSMSIGDKATIFIPSQLGYGEQGAGGVIPPNSDLVFELELVGLADGQ